MKMVRMTRHEGGDAPDFVRNYVTWGGGPRASQFLVLGGKTRAALHGRYFVTTEDIRAVARPVLRHRIITNFNAEAENIRPDDIIRRLIDTLPRDESESLESGRLPNVLRSANAG
jgi:MoxR-like ATPase